MNVTHLECGLCGLKHEAQRLLNLCKQCGKPLLVRYDLKQAARTGLEAFIFMPNDTPRANIVECEQTGAQVTLMAGLITDCGAEVGRRKDAEGWFDVSTLKEPYRVEGKKTLGYELAEQLSWELPDVIIYPTGGGTGLIGMWKAFDGMEQKGWIGSKRPRMVTVQARG